MYRQGDVLIEKIEEVLDFSLLEEVERDNTFSNGRMERRVVLAYGEVNGHAHAIKEDNVSLYKYKEDFKKDNHLYLVVNNDSPVKLYHEEHAAIMIEKGVYKISRQIEYSPEEIRVVAD
jgi:hypothetical protein